MDEQCQTRIGSEMLRCPEPAEYVMYSPNLDKYQRVCAEHRAYLLTAWPWWMTHICIDKEPSK